MISAEIDVTAQFGDIDPMNVVWHGHYTRFLERARDALMEKIGYSYPEMTGSGYLWPIVELQVKYVRPIRLAQRIIVAATLVEFENRLKIAYRCRDAATGEVLTKAHTVQVAVASATQELRMECPAALTDRVRALL